MILPYSRSEPTGRSTLPDGVELLAPCPPAFAEILTPAALGFLADLERRFRRRRKRLLEQRHERQARYDAGQLPAFPRKTRVRRRKWRVAPAPADLLDRRVEISAPANRRMIIEALNCGARVFTADLEDALAPTWRNVVCGQYHLRDAVRGTIEANDPVTGQRLVLRQSTATLMVRPRGWHLDEKHVRVDGEPVSAALFDFGMYLFHNAQELLARGSGPYFCLSKLEGRGEARLWNQVFSAAQGQLGLERGTIRATVLMETVSAVFEMDEILYALRDHALGLGCGHRDYVFSFIKAFREHPEFMLPDRESVGLQRDFLAAVSRLVVDTCHRRGAHALGSLAAQIPVKDDLEASARVLERVRAAKRDEVSDGLDGTWVAHPGLVAVAQEEFDAALSGPHQIDVEREPAAITAEDLLRVPEGEVTHEGVQRNLSVGLRYLATWLCGYGCVPIDHQLEDAATAEISRAQVWQWIRHGARLADGRQVDAEFVCTILEELVNELRTSLGEVAFRGGRFDLAREILEGVVTADQLVEFLTIEAYGHL